MELWIAWALALIAALAVTIPILILGKGPEKYILLVGTATLIISLMGLCMCGSFKKFYSTLGHEYTNFCNPAVFARGQTIFLLLAILSFVFIIVVRIITYSP